MQPNTIGLYQFISGQLYAWYWQYFVSYHYYVKCTAYTL